MILSSDELEILEYLKSWNGKYVNMVEICRCAGGRRRFKDEPNWARPLMGRLVDAKMVEVNERGHYRIVDEADTTEDEVAEEPVATAKPMTAMIVGDDYFPASNVSAEEPVIAHEPQRWIAPHIAALLKKGGKKRG